MRSTVLTLLTCLFPYLLVAQGAENVKQQVDSLLDVAKDRRDKNKLDEAFSLCDQAETMAVQQVGAESVPAAACYHLRGTVFYNKADYKEAEKWELRAKEIREKSVPIEDMDNLRAMSDLGNLYRKTGRYDEGRPLFEQVKSVLEGLPNGKNEDTYGAALTNYALLLTEIGEYEQCETLYRQALTNRETIMGKESREYAIVLTNLGLLYSKAQLPELAKEHYEEAARIFKAVLGADHPYYFTARSNLSSVLWKLGDEKQAEAILLECTEAHAKTVGKDHPKYGYDLFNLGVQRYKKADFDRAEPYLNEAYSIFRSSIGENHPMTAQVASALATLHYEKGAFEESEKLQVKALEKLEEKAGKKSTDYCLSLLNLGRLYKEQKDFQKAEASFLEVKRIFEEEITTEEHVAYLSCLNFLVNLYLETERIEDAVPLMEKVHQKWAQKPMKNEGDYITSLTLRARLDERRGNFDQSDADFEKAMQLSTEKLALAVTYLSENELASYSQLHEQNISDLHVSLMNRATNSGTLTGIAYDQALFQKGFLQKAAMQLNRAALENADTREAYFRLKGYRRRLSEAYADAQSSKEAIAELEEKSNTAEKELARLMTGYSELSKQAHWQDVWQQLKPNEAAIEFVRIDEGFPRKTGRVRYAALLLSKKNLQPVFIPLCEENRLFQVLGERGTRRSDYVNRVYATKALYDLIWKPIEGYLTNAKTIYFAPVGLLHRIQLDAIPLSENRVLRDELKLVHLNSTRQLIENQSLTNSHSNYAALIGGVQFDMDEGAISSTNLKYASRSIDGTRGLIGFSDTDSTLRVASQGEQPLNSKEWWQFWKKAPQPLRGDGDTWGYLSWTEKEVDALHLILQNSGFRTAMFKGYDATEEAFKSLGNNNSQATKSQSPRVLHLATHGYFFPDPKREINGESGFKTSEHPMIRSGIILAGGNHAWKNGQPLKPNMEDGVLTAYEIAQMDFSDTELVVLSACETGLGDIQGNEGVYGLQRAFKIAGARYLIMSLWQVPDYQTQELMTAFYDNWLTQKMELPEAFRAAQTSMRQKYEHPYFWAGFVLVQ